MIKLPNAEWKKILKNLKVDYAHKPSIFLIRDTMRRELGFTVRYHNDVTTTVYLDFFDDVMESYFHLKYMNHES